MNFYKFHSEPHLLHKYDVKHTLTAELAWDHGMATKEWNEEIIAKDAEFAYQYASKILKRRFELGEPAIAKDGYQAYKYAKDILNRRFKEAEDAIANYHAVVIPVLYAEKFLKGAFPAAEKNIANNSNYSYTYAKDVLEKRFKLGEPAIFKDPAVCAEYCKHFKIETD